MAYMDLDLLREDITSLNPMVPVCEAIVGKSCQIIYSESNKKLVILQGFNRIKIIPILHENLIQFKNMHKRDQYLFATQTRDRF